MLGKKEFKSINQIGDGAAYVEKNYGVVKITHGESKLTDAEILENFKLASVDLSSYTNTFQEKVHIDRIETTKLFDWITTESSDTDSNISLLVGNAGCGKSVIMKDLNERLNQHSIPVLAIKADRILNVNSIKEIEDELSLGYDIVSMYKTLLAKYPICVLLIDQIDALSQSLSSKRQTINSYDKIINRLSSLDKNIKIIISTRTYDLNHDPIIRSYKRHNTINVTLLSVEQVDSVLAQFQIDIYPRTVHFKEFLRTPLHLNLFCKIGLFDKFDENISRQKLYDEIWEKYITSPSLLIPGKAIDRLSETLTAIAQHMNEQQHIVVDKRQYPQYTDEIVYLLHHELLVESSSNKLQFIHQSFFDYTYARTFVQSGKSITSWLQERHQGLFIRSQVKQVFAYLRDLNPQLYIQELRELITSPSYRFHLKMLVITDIGFYVEPLIQEQKLVERIILDKPLFFRLFLESISSIKWFQFIETKHQFKALLPSEDEHIQDVLMKLCTRLVTLYPKEIIDFLDKNPISQRIMENTLLYVEDEHIHLSHNLYKKVVRESNFRFRGDLEYLDISIDKHPHFVIEELQQQLVSNLKSLYSFHFDDDYIPGGYSALLLYQKLYNKHPNIAIPFFIETINKITNQNIYSLGNGQILDSSFSDFRPVASNEVYQDYKDLYNVILHAIETDNLNSDSIKHIESLVDSNRAVILSIGVYLLLHHPERYINKIFMLFQREGFIPQYALSDILKYYTNFLIGKVYPLFTQEQQVVINKLFLNANPDEDLMTYVKRGIGVSVFGYTRYLLTSYTLISMIPSSIIDQYPDMRRRYQEGFRKFGEIRNTPPETIQVRVGSVSYGSNVYNKMGFDDWRKTFRKLNSAQKSMDDWDKPSLDGNREQFQLAVKEYPEYYLTFLSELIHEGDIVIDYLISGINGLNESNIDKKEVEKVILVLIQERKHLLSDFEILQVLWMVKKICQDNSGEKCLIQRDTLEFIIDCAIQSNDRTDNLISVHGQAELIPHNLYNAGRNSIRGAAIECLVMCYNMQEYEEQIFSTLEYLASNSNNVTRSCIIMHGAYLNRLDKQKAFNLYLKCVEDYDPLLLGLSAHKGHPLYYLNYINFKELIPFYQRAIAVETKEVGDSMSNFLLNAYMNDVPESYLLLDNLIKLNNSARINIIKNLSTAFKHKKFRSKRWKLLNDILCFDNKELGEEYATFFLHVKEEYSLELETFITNYLNSPISQFKNSKFYQFLRALVRYNPEQCLSWFFLSAPDNLSEKQFSSRSHPLNVLIEAYNGIREYDKENQLLEKAMDTFDSLLSLSEYRSYNLKVVLKELDA